MELGKKEIMEYGRRGLATLGTGKKAYGLIKKLPLFQKRKQARMIKKENKQTQRQERCTANRGRQSQTLWRLRVVGRFLLVLQRRYF